MSSAAIRTFHRSDREQLAELVNAHVAAVIPGVSVSVSTVMSQLEREPHEPVVDPWVVERRTLVAVERAAVVGAALLLRYAAGEEVGPAYRASGEIRWLVCLPDHPAAGDRLAEGCVRVLEEWRVERQLADGGLPSLACTGVPACWPHVRAIYERAGSSTAATSRRSSWPQSRSSRRPVRHRSPACSRGARSASAARASRPCSTAARSA